MLPTRPRPPLFIRHHHHCHVKPPPSRCSHTPSSITLPSSSYPQRLHPNRPQQPTPLLSLKTHHQSRSISTSTPTSLHKALVGLKSTALKSVAIAVGAGVSGTKAEVASGIEGCVVNAGLGEDGGEGSRLLKKEMRVLSIDMGIRNLAFACLSVKGEREGMGKIGGGGEVSMMRLDGWKRVAVTSPPPSSSNFMDEGTATQSRLTREEEIGLDSNISTTKRKSKAEAQARELTDVPLKESFEPSKLAAHAYAWASHLLTTYNPTHILIERQRFRSGGSSAVLEWTLRVGVLEGMMHAVFHSLARERGLIDLEVVSIDPGRVSRYWLNVLGEEDPNKTIEVETKEKKSAREVKLFKIQTVARLLSSSSSSASNSSTEALIRPASDEQRTSIEAFLKRVMVSSRSSQQLQHAGRSKSGERRRTVPMTQDKTAPDVSKIDDLADALLMAVTWLRWIQARDCLAEDPHNFDRLISLTQQGL